MSVMSLTFETSSKMEQGIAMESAPSLRDIIKPHDEVSDNLTMILILLLSLQQLWKMWLPPANPMWMYQLGNLWSPLPTIPHPQPHPIQMNISQDKFITISCSTPLLYFPFLMWLISGDPWPRARNIVQKMLQAPSPPWADLMWFKLT